MSAIERANASDDRLAALTAQATDILSSLDPSATDIPIRVRMMSPAVLEKFVRDNGGRVNDARGA